MSIKTRNEKQIKIKAPIVEALKQAYNNPTYQFHIPGHTKGLGTLQDFRKLVGKKALMVDTTDEFDNLGTLTPATGPIKEAEILAAEAFGAKRTFFLLNGSTIGNLAVAMGLTKKGQKVIVNRNCHRSILTGLIISGAEPLWIVPEKVPASSSFHFVTWRAAVFERGHCESQGDRKNPLPRLRRTAVARGFHRRMSKVYQDQGED